MRELTLGGGIGWARVRGARNSDLLSGLSLGFQVSAGGSAGGAGVSASTGFDIGIDIVPFDKNLNLRLPSIWTGLLTWPTFSLAGKFGFERPGLSGGAELFGVVALQMKGLF